MGAVWATINGDEASAFLCRTSQYLPQCRLPHALRRDIEATGDWSFLRSEGAGATVETARLYADLGLYKPNGPSTFHIFGIHGP
ncbi:MAG: hypothetical protein IPQ14_14600 [Candidatus Microthrix sp.]|uniref:hypothetical protein n=1 Tax=Candidatus Neomicrothrix sp. TaxID=2719034 RepID=UPI0025C48085|nr:hypothetical protein [Candidatus Microthrix sp.]MBL0205508.1 hypothetical protein [Candidatus Microthrix sp.]